MPGGRDNPQELIEGNISRWALGERQVQPRIDQALGKP
jgi:hypothetical protein